jgi:GNAT superfamily N-acetyltransferase
MTEPTRHVRELPYTVRPMLPADGPQVIAAFEHMSEASRRARFFSPVPRIHAGMAADLTLIDDQRIVLIAVGDDGSVAAEARAVRSRLDPSTAEVALTVLDAHQRQGLGTRLLRCLGSAAREAGITRFVGHVLVDNVAARALLDASGAARRVAEPGIYGFEIPLVPSSPRREQPATLGRAS